MDGKISSYMAAETSGKSQLDLVIMVYKGAIAAFQAGKKAYAGGDFDEGHNQLEKARRFIVHLYTTLDPEKGGEIAKKLGSLYSFVINQISVIEATKDPNLIDDNITILENVCQGWQGLKPPTPATKESPGPAGKSGSGSFVTSA